MAFLEVSGIGRQNERGVVLADVSFELAPFKKLAICGETGSGKSTLLKIIAGIAQPDAGLVMFNGTRVKGPEEKLLPGHDGIAYLSQQYELRNHYRVEELLDMASKMTDDAASEIYKVCRIDHLVKRRTDQLSGGEKQRIALAGLLVSAPGLLLLDEPFSNLDLIHKSILKSVIEAISSQLKITCILASHDPVDILSWADEIIVLKNGESVQQGDPETLYYRPINEYVGGLLGPYNLIPAAIGEPLGFHFPAKSNRRLFIRPEQISIRKENQNAVSGIVMKLRFMGSYHEVFVEVSGTVLTLITRNTPLIGSKISIAIDAGEALYL